MKQYVCDLAFTPSIISDSFLERTKARDMEFSTCSSDRPIIVQFAANNATDFADASELVARYCQL